MNGSHSTFHKAPRTLADVGDDVPRAAWSPDGPKYDARRDHEFRNAINRANGDPVAPLFGTRKTSSLDMLSLAYEQMRDCAETGPKAARIDAEGQFKFFARLYAEEQRDALWPMLVLRQVAGMYFPIRAERVAAPTTPTLRGALVIDPDVERKNRLMEKNHITHQTGVDPEDLEEIWQGANYSLDNWVIREARSLKNGYILYPAPGLPIGCQMPALTIPGSKVLFYVVLFIKGTTDRIIFAAVGNQGEILYKAKRGDVRDYLIKTRKQARKVAVEAVPFVSATTLAAG